MKCFNCGAELSDDTRFCSYCGVKIEPPAPAVEPAPVEPEIAESHEKNPVAESAPVESATPVEKPKKSFGDQLKERVSEMWGHLSLYGKIATIGIGIFIVLCLVAFLAGKTFAGIIAIVGLVLIVVALLMKKQIIKAPKSWLHYVALALAFVMIVPYFSVFRVDYGDAENLNWSEIILGNVIPEPDPLFGEVMSNHEDYLSVYIYKIDPADYKAYVDECKTFGYTIDADEGDISYYAFNSAGYKLSLFYTESDKKMHIGVDAAKEYSALTWPTSGLGTLIPAPSSTNGEITQNDDEGFNAYVSNTTVADFSAYTNACADAGFNVEAYNTEQYYSAENAEGYKLSIDYQGNNVIYITIDVPEYEVSIEVECVENLIFSKYDVDVYINDDFEGTITHGETETFELTLRKGTYTLIFVSEEDDELTGETTLHIYQDENLKYKISCSSTGIDVDTIVGTTPLKDTTNEGDQDGTASGYTLDYSDAASFEAALNNGEKVNGKIVQFAVSEYKPDSALGINCWAGEHLNFISENELDVSAGDIVIGYITSEPSKVMGSWKIPYEVLAINDIKTDVSVPSEPEETTPPETTEPEITTIVMTADSSSYEGKNYSDVKAELEALGFTEVTTNEKVTTDASYTNGAVISVVAGDAAFSAGDAFEKDIAITITYWKVEEPVSEYELAFVRKLNGYSLYYMFDTDTKTVVQFGTDDTYLYRGTYTGSFSSGVTMTWDHGEWTDKFKYSEGSSRATYYDGYGYDWEYTVCDLKTAQDILDTRER